MKPLIYLKTSSKYNDFELVEVKKTIEDALIDNNQIYSNAPISNDFDVAHFFNLDDVSFYSNYFKKVKKVVSLFFSEEDFKGNFLKEASEENKLINLKYEISLIDKKILNKVDLIYVPSNDAKNFLINLGIETKIKVMELPIDFKKFNLKNNILEKAIYSYLRLSEDKFLTVTTIKNKDDIALEKLIYLANKFDQITFIVISQFSSESFLPLKFKNLLKYKPKNVIFTKPLTYDLYFSLMYNAKIYLNLNSLPGNILEIYEAMASKTQIFALESSIFKDILIDKKNCYLYNNIDSLRIGIDQYYYNLIDSTCANAYEEISKRDSKTLGKELINDYLNITED